VTKEIFNDVRFRQACSVAINRDEINELVFLGQGTPRQATINQTATFFEQKWADHYAQFDPDLANQLLDEIGLDEKGADGVRLRPDGQPMTFQLEYLPHEGPKKEVCELVVKHWAAVGLKAEAAGRERNFLMTRLNTMEHDASGWHVDRQLERIAWENSWQGSKLGPGGNSGVTYCNGWKQWLNSAGETGIEPPEEAKQLAAAFDEWTAQAMGTPDYVAAAKLTHDLIAETLWIIGTLIGPQPVIVKNDLENVFTEAVYSGEEKFWWGAANWFWNTTRGDQWFFK
jgi:peptide/nickel transport system substrate-binding protein